MIYASAASAMLGERSVDELQPRSGRGLKFLLAALLAKKAALMGAGLLALGVNRGVPRSLGLNFQGDGQGNVNVGLQSQGDQNLF